jgi:hypothetical protein
MRIFLPILLLLLATGCARYEFDLIEPPDLAQHISRDRESIFKRDELEYQLQSYDNRLVMRIVNPTDEAIELIGPESFVVDPNGQSHPLRSQSIAPHSYIKLILPPLRPYYRTGPSFGIGIGVSASRGYGRRYWPGYRDPFYDPFYDSPRYMVLYDESDTTYWSWEGETEARVRLTFRRNNQLFHHNFLFRRKKV